eukprot:jgi/Undpi1/3328/HiC_scaffold_15.g06701.m1
MRVNVRRRLGQWLRGGCSPSLEPSRRAGLTSLSLSEASRKVRAGEVRPSDLTEACLNQMERSSWLNCFVTRCTDSARLEAEAADARQTNGTLLGPLDGIPYAAKDNFCTLGVPTTASSDALAGSTPPYDATPVERLRQSGAPLLGKTNMDEFGMGSGTLFSSHGPTLNPWSPADRNETVFVPGGSSGGSAAAVSSGACFAPAAFCGVVGLKPTYGLVPRHGLIAYASSLVGGDVVAGGDDTVGVLTRSVLDSAMMLDVIAGPDTRDSTCVPSGGSQGGFASALLDEGYAPTPHPPPHPSSPSRIKALAAYAVLASAEASSNLSRYDGLRYGTRLFRDQGELHEEITRTRTAGFGDEVRVKLRILTGCYVLCESAYHDYYELAIEVQKRLRREMRAALSVADVLLAPTTPFPPFPSGPPSEAFSHLLNDVLTVPISLAGVPAISIPVAIAPAITAVASTVATRDGPGGRREIAAGGGTGGGGGGGGGRRRWGRGRGGRGRAVPSSLRHAGDRQAAGGGGDAPSRTRPRRPPRLCITNS